MKNGYFIRVRKNNRYTQKQMACILGISYSLYQKIEYGLRRPPTKVYEVLKTKFSNDFKESQK